MEAEGKKGEKRAGPSGPAVATCSKGCFARGRADGAEGWKARYFVARPALGRLASFLDRPPAVSASSKALSRSKGAYPARLDGIRMSKNEKEPEGVHTKAQRGVGCRGSEGKVGSELIQVNPG